MNQSVEYAYLEQHALPDEPDLIARGMGWEETVKVCRESCEQAGFKWDNITPTALNVLQRTANNAHKLGFKLALSRVASAQQVEPERVNVTAAEHEVLGRALMRSVTVLEQPVAQQVEGEAVGSSACPICGKDTPHAHHTTEVIDWLRAQASRFVGDADKTLNISLRRDAPEEKLRQEVEHLKKIIEHREDDDREERVRAMATAMIHPTPPTSAAVPAVVWEAANKSSSMLFATEHDAKRWVSQFALSVAGGFHIAERAVHRMAATPTQPAQPAPEGQR